jgi:hypothetical protein
MSVGIHNLFSDPAWVGGLHQDPSSAAIIKTAFTPTITTTNSFSASSYGDQCSNNLFDNKADCEAVSSRTWHRGAPGTIAVDTFDSNAAGGDQITFSTSATAGDYVTSRQSTLTLTQYHVASTGASTLTGVFDGPVVSGATVVSHKTHLPRWISSPGRTVVQKDSVVTLTAQSSFDVATHNYYTGGTAFRWLTTNHPEMCGPFSMLPRDHVSDYQGDAFDYPADRSINNVDHPRIYYTNSAKNGEAQGGDLNVDILNVTTPSSNTCVLEIGPFGSLFNSRLTDVWENPTAKGSWWWCEQLLLDSSVNIQMVLQSPVFYLEVRD